MRWQVKGLSYIVTYQVKFGERSEIAFYETLPGLSGRISKRESGADIVRSKTTERRLTLSRFSVSKQVTTDSIDHGIDHCV